MEKPGAMTIPALPFALDAYLARIALKEAPAADADGLATLQRAHRLAIPFENLDIALGRGIGIDPVSVFAKLVSAKRGGYCFEHGQLFLDALEALGFAARPLLARVWLGRPEAVPPLTHTLALVTIDGAEWIADAGFGGSYAPPMPLADGEEAESPDGARFRLARDPEFGWMLSRNGHGGMTDGRSPGEGWQDQYSFTLAPVFPADLALGNFWVSEAPESRFVQNRIVSVPLPHGFATLNGRAYRRHSKDQSTEAEIGDPRVYRMRLSMMFGIDLTAEEVAALGLFGGG
ncbi:arylamine N-acetyltransferase [Sphingomonas sp. BIUV-7]|uniref:Arylamine N-acetyltransferase n=1 Tax=Sphingomonas natans TaxID=3063330 RepID=A0ABT8YEV1_9SPHN|nr:arylamine N-acetyltransferase [Sphingomonas sp. BIUV-7]MDO6416846.1 arylamine N-acetyltransferase [Sphingomonas sp. BIUV-7]